MSGEEFEWNCARCEWSEVMPASGGAFKEPCGCPHSPDEPPDPDGPWGKWDRGGHDMADCPACSSLRYRKLPDGEWASLLAVTGSGRCGPVAATR